MAEDTILSQVLNDTLLTRRSFVKWSSVLGGTAALGGALLETGLKPLEHTAQAQQADGEWITAACWHNCGGRCLLKAQVVDGVVTRIKADDFSEEDGNVTRLKACTRGYSKRQQILGADRLKYPMKRKNWEPGGGNKELRGKDEWVRISWEEALDIVASETQRIKETYGNKSILSPVGNGALNLSAWYVGRALSLYGGFMPVWGTTSWGALPLPGTHMTGVVVGGVHDRMSVRQSKLIVLWGANPVWSSAGNPTYHYMQAKKAGAKFIVVDPFYSPSASSLADEWIPCRPSTDAALLIGMAYHMITNNLHDQEFLDTYTKGFDAEHMPEGADPEENFKDYVLGTFDGVPKTPEWAAAICGTPPELIRSFAEEVCSTKPTAFITGYAPSRTNRGEQFIQAFYTVGWMTGNVGQPGAMVGVSCKERAGDTGPVAPALVYAGDMGVPPIENPINKYGFPGGPAEATDWEGFVWNEAWEAVVTGEYTAGVRGKIPCDIRMIWNIGDMSSLNQLPNINRGIEAFRKVEFVVSSDSYLTTPCKYSDVVLPVTTPWERWGGIMNSNTYHSSRRDIFIYHRQVIEPLFEAKDDAWIEAEIGKRLGLDPEVINPLSEKQMVYNMLAGAQVVKEDGKTFENLLTITAEDIAEMGVEGQPQTGRITYQELAEKGLYQVPRAPGDNLGLIYFEDFRKDPEANPLNTETGKLQIHSQKLADEVTNYGWTELPPIPKYIPPPEGVEDARSGEYPLQLYSIHYMRRSHSTYDNVPWLREAFPQELFMNTLDAEARGLKTGDMVLVTSPHGKVLRPVAVTPRMMPGVVALGEGAWVERDDETGIDKAGASNSLNGTNPCGQGVQPWNTNIVQVARWEGQPLLPDANWPQRVIFDKES